MKKDRPLTERQERFVVEYATLGNGAQAALNAGYSKKIAAVMSCRLLKNPLIKSLLKNIKKKDAKKAELTREHILKELARGLFRDPAGLENERGFVVSSIKDIPIELRTIIDSFKVVQELDREGNPYSQKIEVKLVSKASVIDMAMKHIGAYAAEKQESKLSLDWDSLYGRSKIVDPVEDEIKQLKK